MGWAPLTADQVMSFTIYSYDGKVFVGIAADAAWCRATSRSSRVSPTPSAGSQAGTRHRADAASSRVDTAESSPG